MIFQKPTPHILTKLLKQRQNRRQVEAVKRQVRARDHFMCRCCNRKDQLDTHEHKRRGAGGEVSLENSFTACRICHSLIQSRHIEVIARSAYVVGLDAQEAFFNANEPIQFLVPKAIADVLFSRYIPSQVTVLEDEPEEAIDESLGQA